MTSKDKLIGISLIVIGSLFIVLGIAVGTKTMPSTKNTQIYTEVQQENTTNSNNTETNENNVVTVYNEEENYENYNIEQENEQEEESTRYIY